MTRTPSAEAFLAARDFCLRHRADYETALRDFTWPRLEQFNWALEDERRMRKERVPLEFFEEEFIAGERRGNS